VGDADRPTRQWPLRAVPEHLRARYVAEGWWDDDSLGATVANGLATLGATPFNVFSAVRPWRGTFADIDRSARALAGSLRARGVGPGDVVAFQLPNWAEAGVTFWAAAYLGAVVVPIVHFYGAKEVAYIVRTVQPEVLITADRFGSVDHLELYGGLYGDRFGADDGRDHPTPQWVVVGDTPPGEIPDGATPFASLADPDLVDAEPLDGPLPVDPDSPALVAFTSGTTRDPKGVIHSHRTIGFETRQLDHMFPRGGPAQITGAPVGHFIGMLNAFLVPLLRERSVNLIDVWDPSEVLRLMRTERLGVGGGATYFLTSLLDHPHFTSEHLAMMPFAGLGGSSVPVPVMERLAAMGIEAFRSYGSTEHPSITGCLLDEPAVKRMTTDGSPLPGVEIRLDEAGEISSRGPDLFMGYVDPVLTEQAFDDDGWYRTGDVGVVDEDGYLTITDRVADVIIRGGENISAQEVEELLMGLAGVVEVSVVAAPDPRLGERAAAVLRLGTGAGRPAIADVRAHLAAAGLAKQKWPESLHVVDEFPRTPSGKVQKFVLRQQLRDGALDAYDAAERI
jgi:acyl-CoA synthetase (AMP-forming)/AMP-acid ligase II